MKPTRINSVDIHLIVGTILRCGTSKMKAVLSPKGRREKGIETRTAL